MSKSSVFENVRKNRYLIISAVLLTCGIVFGKEILDYLPQELCRNIFEIASKKSDNFYITYIDRFTLPFVIITALYLSGFSAAGQITAGLAMFADGAIYGIKNTVNYSFVGKDYIIPALFEYFTFTAFIGFLLLIMSENAFASAKKIYLNVKSEGTEKPRYNAKNITVKYITFTAVFAAFSAFSAFISGAV